MHLEAHHHTCLQLHSELTGVTWSCIVNLPLPHHNTFNALRIPTWRHDVQYACVRMMLIRGGMSRDRARAEAGRGRPFLRVGLEFDPVVYAGRSLQGGKGARVSALGSMLSAVRVCSIGLLSTHPIHQKEQLRSIDSTGRTIHNRATKAKILEIFPEHRSSSPSRKHRFTHTPQGHHASIASIHHFVESTSQPILLARSENVPLPPHKAGPSTGAVLFLGARPTAPI